MHSTYNIYLCVYLFNIPSKWLKLGDLKTTEEEQKEQDSASETPAITQSSISKYLDQSKNGSSF